MDDRRVFEPLGTYKLSVYPLLLVSFIYGAANKPASPLLAIASNLRPPVICDSTGIFGVSVTPPPGSATWDPNTGGHTASFTVTNTGQCTDIYLFSYTPGAPISGVTFNPTTLHLSAGAHGTVTATYGVGNTASGWLTVTATGSFGVQGSGSYFVTATAGPVVSTSPTNGDYIDVSKCVENCFDAVASYATPPYLSGDVPRFVQLNYRSAQAHPMGVVQVDAVDTSSIKPVKMSIQLYTPQSTLVTFTNNSTEIFYDSTSHPADGNVIRLAAQFDASNLTTGSYNYTVVVRSYRPAGTFRETHQPIRILIVNEANSPFGAGWSMGGFQHAYVQGDGGVAITEGNGSLAYFARGTTSCNQYGCTIHYISPKGDFSTVFRDSADTCFPLSCPTYEREYPTGSIVAFDSSLKTKWIGGLLGVFGNMTTFAYNANLLVGITDSIGKTITLGYVSNHLGWIKDPGGRVDSVTVDGSGNLSRIKDWATTNNQGGQPLTFQYDASHRLVYWTDRRGGAWGLSYDFAGKLGADTAPQVTINGLSLRPVKAFASVEQKVLVNPSSGQGSSSNPAPNVDTAVVRATLTNPRGYTTKYALNRFGAATLLQEPLGRTTSFNRDSNSAVVLSVSPSGHLMKYTWSGPDLMQSKDSTTGRTIIFAYSYYSFAHYLHSVSGDVDSLVNYWTQGSLDSTRTGGAGKTTFRYASGRLCGVTDPGGHTGDCYFTSGSGFQNTDSVKHTLGTVGYRYDGHGQQVTTIDEVSDTNKTLYDSIGRPSAAIGPLHETTSFTYDGLYLTQVRDAQGQVYKYWPNALGWVDSTTDPTGKVDRYQYDPNGNRTSWTNRSGQTVTFTYDSLDQVRSVLADGKTTTFFSDPSGRYRAASNSESIDTLRFDSADRPSLAISCRVLINGNAPQCFRDSSVYEIRDARILATLSAPTVWSTTQLNVGHHYDVNQLLDTLTPAHLSTQSGQPITFLHTVESLDSIRTLTGLNNLMITQSYPWTHRTDQVQVSDPSLAAALGTTDNFDNAKRLATRYHGSLANPDTSRSFSYGLQGNLVQYSDTAHQYTTSCTWFKSGYYCNGTDQPAFIGSTTYAYDSVGNRKDPSAPGGGIDHPGNRLRRWQKFRMDYNAVGNMTAKRTLSVIDTTKVLRTDSLFWSAVGRLDSVRTRDSLGALTGRVGYGYDGWGRRVRKSTATSTSRYLWDGDSLMAELDTLGSLLAEYTYYPGMDNVASVLRHDRADSSYYYIQDYSRNVIALLARTGAGNVIDNQYRYDPFGTLQGNGGTAIPNSLQFASREYDPETQLYYYRARYLDPALGRFVSEDPIGLEGGINLYAYVGNDPINRRDPSGTKCSDFQFEDEKLSDKAEHFFLGWALGALFKNGDPWGAVVGGFFLGIAHEGPWGNEHAKFTIGDHDLTDSFGAPCSGYFDTFMFMVMPIYMAMKADGWQFSFKINGGLQWQGSFFPVIPTRPIPQSFPPLGGPPWWGRGEGWWVGPVM